MKKKKIFFIIIGLLLIIIPYFINVYSIYRLLSVLLGLILLEIGIIINKKNRVLLIVLLPIIFWGLSFGIDYGIVHLTKRIPVYVGSLLNFQTTVENPGILSIMKLK